MSSMKINSRLIKRFLQTCHFLGRIQTKLIFEGDQHALSVIRLRRVNRLITCLLSKPCPTGNAWRSHKIKHCLVTIVDVVLSEPNGLITVQTSKTFYQKVCRRSNFIKHDQTRCANGKMFGQQTFHVWTGL